MSEVLSRIEKTFGKREDLYKSMDLKIAAIHADDKWYNLRTVAIFTHEEIEKKIKRIAEVDNFAILSIQSDTSSLLDKLYELMENGVFRYDNETVFFQDSDGVDKTSGSIKYNDYFSRSSEKSRERFGIDWPADYFKSEWHYKNESQILRYNKAVNKQLNCHDPPFEDLRDAIQSALAVDRWDICSSGSMLWVIFPTYLALDTCSLDGITFEASIVFHETIDLRDVRISLIGKGPKIIRKQLEFDLQSMSSKEPSIITAKTEVCLKQVSDVQAYLFLQTDEPQLSLDKKEVRNRRSQVNPRLAAHEMFDIGAERILQLLRSEQLKYSGKFEWAIASILHFCGFQTEQLGTQGMGDVPDILAFYPEEDSLIVGECTVGVPDENKILKLCERAEQIRSLDVKIRAVIFSNAEQKMLETVAVPPEVTVVNKEQIEELFDMASRGSSTRQIYSYIFGT